LLGCWTVDAVQKGRTRRSCSHIVRVAHASRMHDPERGDPNQKQH
jgi:hypothetical protein